MRNKDTEHILRFYYMKYEKWYWAKDWHELTELEKETTAAEFQYRVFQYNVTLDRFAREMIRDWRLFMFVVAFFALVFHLLAMFEKYML